MNTVRHILTSFIFSTLLFGISGEAWAQLSASDIIIDESIEHGAVSVTTVDAGTRTVTLSVTPDGGYYVEKSNIVVQKLVDPSRADARRRVAPDIADVLTVSGNNTTTGPDTGTYTFVVPADYAGAFVSVTFTGMNPATATVTPNSLTYTGEEQELVTLGAVVGGAATNAVTYSLTSGGTYTGTIPTGEDAGTYTVYYKVAGDATHSDGGGSVTVTIQRAAITEVTLAQSMQTYTGSPLTFNVSSVKAGTIDVPSTDDYTVSGNTQTNVGNYTLTVTAVENAFHKNFTGTATASYRITPAGTIFVNKNSSVSNAAGNYILTEDVTASVFSGLASSTFTGTLDGDFHTIDMTGCNHALFSTISDGTVKNVILEKVNISSGTNVGAICNEATGDSRIYNCGILSGSVGGSGYVGGLVGLLDGTSRVINCYSFATVRGGTSTGGIVGYNSIATNAEYTDTEHYLKTMVMNCMFYGDITSGSNISPVYGGELIDNAGEKGVNNYNYYRHNRYDRATDTYVDDVTFDDNLALDDYHRSWPADAKYLTRFEYYRSILNSNKKLCTWWVKGTDGTAPTDEDIKEVGIAKWVLDPSIAPYPILKKWGKYPSVINQDPDKRIDPSTQTWVNRNNASGHWGEDMAPDTDGQKLGTVTVTINAGAYHSGSYSKSIPITAMDTDNYDYCYGKIQLPYYNEIFGNPNGTTWDAKYGGNYTAYVVTGWDISGGSAATEYNFADRNSYSGRVYAQGGYFYVPKGVTSITITAHWANAVYLCNKDFSIDRVNVASGEKEVQNSNPAKTAKYGSPFTPAGTIPTTFQGRTVYTTIKEAIGALSKTSSGKDVYNQAIVLIGNVQVRNHSSVYGKTGDDTRPFTLMSADLDFDNEPDNCLELQFRNDIDRPGVQPIRFDFLPVPELGLAMRTNKLAYAIGIMVPLGHFEITETAYFHTTQFEYDANVTRNGKSPVIINGGEHEMFNKRKQAGAGNRDRTSYFLLGGNAWIHRFAPGAHPNSGDKPDIYLCPVNVIGGQIKELYLTGLYRPELPAGGSVIGGAPRCYIDGGKFDIIAGAGYDKVLSGDSVIFKINHSLIGEFYGGGINGSNPIDGNINVTINNSQVDKYCGGPKVGDMTGKKVTTHAKGTTFGVFYGGGNGGNSYYRQMQDDGDWPSEEGVTDCVVYDGIISDWTHRNYHWNEFNPLAVKDEGTENKGYHAEYEFEVFNQSNGLSEEITQRGFIHWIQFGITTTGDVSNTLENCKVTGNFYGGGNLATVKGSVTSELTNTQVDGSVFGAGYSAAIPTFQVQDKDNKTFPSISDAGVITDGNIPYTARVYEWTNEPDAEDHDADYMKGHPTYSKTVNGETKWYCYTWNSLEDLGTVTGAVTLTIDGESIIGASGTGNVYGGGDASAVNNTTTPTDASTTVILKGKARVNGDVFGGGNHGEVSGSTKVEIKE